MMLNLTNLCGFNIVVSSDSPNPLSGAIWNWSDRHTLIDNISGDSLKVWTSQVSAWAGIRATKFVAPGEIAKFEIYIADGVGGYTDSHACGVSLLSASLYNANSSLIGDSGHYLVGKTTHGYVSGNYLGFKADRVANTLYVYKNGVALTTKALPSTDNLYPLTQLLGSGVTSSLINFTESSFVYAVP